jgi:hypothetical protein
VSYRPAQCNIGRRQRRRRAALSLAALGVAGVVVVAYVVGILPRLLLAGVFVPLALAFEWGVQAYESFCVRLALLGRYEFDGETDGDTRGTVTDPQHRREDRRHALRISVVSVVLAAIATAAIVALL